MTIRSTSHVEPALTVDADGVVHVGRKRDLELGAYAIGAGDQYRLAHAAGDSAESRKAANASELLSDARALRERLDAPNQLFACIDVDARLTIGKTAHGGATYAARE